MYKIVEINTMETYKTMAEAKRRKAEIEYKEELPH